MFLQSIRNHGVQTMEEAIALLRKAYETEVVLIHGCYIRRNDNRVRIWLNRSDHTLLHPITSDMLSDAAPYEVMLSKMLRTAPEPKLLLLSVNEKVIRGQTPLHCVARSGNVASIKTVLNLYPKSEWLQVVNLEDNSKRAVLHYVAESGNVESLKFILSLYTKQEQLQSVRAKTSIFGTLLHHAASSGNFECFNVVLDLYPESEHLTTVRVKDLFEKTALHYAASSGNVECIKTIIDLYPESERLQAVR